MSTDKLNLIQIVPNWHSLGFANCRDKCSQYANIAVGGYLLRQQVSNWMRAKVFTRYNNVLVLLISVLNPEITHVRLPCTLDRYWRLISSYCQSNIVGVLGIRAGLMTMIIKVRQYWKIAIALLRRGMYVLMITSLSLQIPITGQSVLDIVRLLIFLGFCRSNLSSGQPC